MKSFLLILFVLYHNVAFAEISVIDDAGNKIVLQSPAKRIISLSPGTTELVFFAGGGRLLKGVVSFSDYPSMAKLIPQVGSYNAVDLEAIVSLKPDLVIAWQSGNPELQISKLKKLGLTVFLSESRDFSDIPKTLRRFGILMDTQLVAEKSASEFEAKLKLLEEKYTGKFPKKSVFIQIWNKPVMSINGQHLISKIIEKCNGVNIFHDYSHLTLSPNSETILAKNPDVIIVSRKGLLGNKWKKRWAQWQFLKAVRSNSIFMVNPDNVVRHTPRILIGMEDICQKLNDE